MNSKLSAQKVLGVPVTLDPEINILTKVNTAIVESKLQVILTPNPEILVKSYFDSELLASLESSDINIPDGVGVATVLKIPVIKGREFMLKLFKLAEDSKRSVYFLGSNEKVIQSCQRKIAKEYPRLKIAGWASPSINNDGLPVQVTDWKIEREAISEIKKKTPGLVIVALGAPKQEKWIKRMVSENNITKSVIMSVGGSLDFYSGSAKVPPSLFSRLYLEWFWRLTQEPHRWRRIVNAVIVYPLLLIFDSLRDKK